jgi:hypothetical protein
MGGAFRPYGRRGIASPDWAMIAVGLMALALLAGAMVRTGTPAAQALFGTQVGGLRTLSETETLVLFEDHASGVGDDAGWSAGLRNDDHPGLGAIWLVEPSDVVLTRDIALPEGTIRAVLSLDLIAIDDWALQGLSVAIGDLEVLQHRFTSRPGLDRPAAPAPMNDGSLALRARLDGPREQGFAAGDPALAEERLRIELSVREPGDILTVTITPLAAPGQAPAPDGPLWAVDNLILVADSQP